MEEAGRAKRSKNIRGILAGMASESMLQETGWSVQRGIEDESIERLTACLYGPDPSIFLFGALVRHRDGRLQAEQCICEDDIHARFPLPRVFAARQPSAIEAAESRLAELGVWGDGDPFDAYENVFDGPAYWHIALSRETEYFMLVRFPKDQDDSRAVSILKVYDDLLFDGRLASTGRL